LLTATLALAVAASAGGVRAPERLTAGTGNQFLGALSPDRSLLYFVSDEESTTRVYVQDVARGIPRLLFEEMADVTWPRPSPDGKRLLYISYRTDAAGDLCVRDLPAGERRCLTDEKSAELQAVWLPDGKNIAVLTRGSLHGDLELREVSPAGGLGATLARGNLSSPSFSPDGRWLAYIPIERGSRDIGPSFLARAGDAIDFVRLDGKAGAAQRAVVDLPGTSAFPGFSADGKWLYFTQFLNDTNLDGTIDGNDNGVLFRVEFTDGRLGPPDQLTSARWNCQYPIPAADRLVATCLQHGSLDVFTIPLDGGVPPEWSLARLDDELSASTDRWERLLLLSHRGNSPAVLEEMIRLHLELGELESALFYAHRLEKSDATTGLVLVELCGHRKADAALSLGMLSSAFVRDARSRLDRLAQVRHPLAAVVRSEILDTLGDETAARAALDGVDVADPLVASLYADRLLDLYRGEPRYFDLYRPLAERDLGHAQAFVRELARGAGPAERARRADEWLKRVDPDSDLAFLLALERALADLTPETQEPVRARVFDIYRRNKELERRKALVGATVRGAVAADNEYLLYQFADTWVSFVPRERAERRYAEALFRDAVLERAYVEEARQKIGDARGRFFGVTLQTESLEAHAGFIEMRLLEKIDPAKDYAKDPDGVPARYARAYLLAQGLLARRDPVRREGASAQAIAELQAIAAHAPQRAEVHLLWAYIAHVRWLLGGDRLAAVEANAHYLMALDLARESPRHRATILEGVARLQSSVGNYAIALGFLEERHKLPFPGELPRFAHGLALARARYHLADAAGAAAMVDELLSANDAALARFRPIALDRSALYHLEAGDAAVAAERYAALWPLVEKDTAPDARRNRVTTQLGWAAATLAAKRAGEALAHISAAEKLLGAGPPAPRDGPYGRERPPGGLVPGDYVMLLEGLRAQASLLAGNLPEAAVALGRRRDALAARLGKDDLDEDRVELALAEAQLALVAHRRREDDQALLHLGAARAYWDEWSARTGTPIDDLGLAIVAGYADLHLSAGVPLERFGFNLPERLAAAYARLSQLRNPAWEPMRARYELYLTLLSLRRTDK
jgi:Tol biopolymer transport system component